RGVGLRRPGPRVRGRVASMGPRPGGAEWDVPHLPARAWCARFNGAAPWGRGVGCIAKLDGDLTAASTGPRPGGAEWGRTGSLPRPRPQLQRGRALGARSGQPLGPITATLAASTGPRPGGAEWG